MRPLQAVLCSAQGTGKHVINQSHTAQASEKIPKGVMVGADRELQTEEQCEEIGTWSSGGLQRLVCDKDRAMEIRVRTLCVCVWGDLGEGQVGSDMATGWAHEGSGRAGSSCSNLARGKQLPALPRQRAACLTRLGFSVFQGCQGCMVPSALALLSTFFFGYMVQLSDLSAEPASADFLWLELYIPPTG